MIPKIEDYIARYGLMLAVTVCTVLPVYSDTPNPNKDEASTSDKSTPATTTVATPAAAVAPATPATSNTTFSAGSGVSPNQATPSSAVPATANATSQPAKSVAKPSGSSEPPPPKGFEAAVKLYSAHKYAAAAGEFEKFIKGGVPDTNTHLYLAYCYYAQRIYSKAIKEFSWVAKNAHSISMQRDAENTVYTLTCYMRGVCPANCLKPNDPRWHHAHMDGFPDDNIWITFKTTGGSRSFSQHHMGDLIEMVNGDAVDKGTCPICGGTGKVRVLKDGQPLPR